MQKGLPTVHIGKRPFDSVDISVWLRLTACLPGYLRSILLYCAELLSSAAAFCISGLLVV